jgi:WD40 repeat protein
MTDAQITDADLGITDMGDRDWDGAQDFEYAESSPNIHRVSSAHSFEGSPTSSGRARPVSAPRARPSSSSGRTTSPTQSPTKQAAETAPAASDSNNANANSTKAEEDVGSTTTEDSSSPNGESNAQELSSVKNAPSFGDFAATTGILPDWTTLQHMHEHNKSRAQTPLRSTRSRPVASLDATRGTYSSQSSRSEKSTHRPDRVAVRASYESPLVDHSAPLSLSPKPSLLSSSGSAFSRARSAPRTTPNLATQRQEMLEMREAVCKKYTRVFAPDRHLQPGADNPRVMYDVQRPRAVMPVRSACDQYESYYAHLKSLGRSITTSRRGSFHAAFDVNWDASEVVPRHSHCALLYSRGENGVDNVAACSLVYEATFEETPGERRKAREAAKKKREAEARAQSPAPPSPAADANASQQADSSASPPQKKSVSIASQGKDTPPQAIPPRLGEARNNTQSQFASVANMRQHNVPHFVSLVCGANSVTATNILNTRVLSLTVASAQQLLLYKIAGEYSGSTIDKPGVIHDLGYHTFAGAARSVPVIEGGVQAWECELLQHTLVPQKDAIVFLLRVCGFTPASMRTDPLLFGHGAYFADHSGTRVPTLSKGFMRFVHDILAQHRVDGVFLPGEQPSTPSSTAPRKSDNGTAADQNAAAGPPPSRSVSFSNTVQLKEQQSISRKTSNADMKQVFAESIKRQSMANLAGARALSSQALINPTENDAEVINPILVNDLVHSGNDAKASNSPKYHNKNELRNNSARKDSARQQTPSKPAKEERRPSSLFADDDSISLQSMSMEQQQDKLHTSEIFGTLSLLSHAHTKKHTTLNRDFGTVDLEWARCSPKPDGHSGLVTCVAFNPEDQIFLASGGVDGDVRLWNISKKDGVCLRRMQHTAPVRAVAFHPSGYTLASCGDDSVVSIWSMSRSDHPHIYTPTSQSPQRALSFNTDGSQLVSGGYRTVTLFDAETGRVASEWSAHALNVYSVCFHPTFNVIVTAGDDNMVKVWDVDSGKCVHRYAGHRGWVNCVRFSEDGMLLGSASQDTTVQIRDWRCNATLYALTSHRAPVHAVEFGAGMIFTGGRDACSRVYSQTTGELVLDFAAHSGSIYGMAYASNLGLIASGGSDQYVRLYNMRYKKLKAAV